MNPILNHYGCRYDIQIISPHRLDFSSIEDIPLYIPHIPGLFPPYLAISPLSTISSNDHELEHMTLPVSAGSLQSMAMQQEPIQWKYQP